MREARRHPRPCPTGPGGDGARGMVPAIICLRSAYAVAMCRSVGPSCGKRRGQASSKLTLPLPLARLLLPLTLPQGSSEASGRPVYVDESMNGSHTLGGLYNRPKYHVGQGGPVDYAEARRLYGLAAAQGQADAQVNLAFMLVNGQGGPERTSFG